MKQKVKTRIFKENNYKGIYFNGKTIRIALDPKKPITDLKYPEFYDVKLTPYCKGKCPYCYQSSQENTNHTKDVLNKIQMFFGGMSENEKPFQVAIGGGEPTEHPDFINVLELFNKLDIMPNYTTNGMFVDSHNCDVIVKATKEYSEGVAVSCHPHLEYYWHKAAQEFISNGVFTNFHNIISDKESVDIFLNIYKQWKENIKYFVLLPMMEKGRGFKVELAWEYLFEELNKLDDISNIAFGANFYPYLKDTKYSKQFNVSLYEPEILSKYLDLEDMKIYGSSFN